MKNLSYLSGMKDGPKSGCIFCRQHIFAVPPPLFQRLSFKVEYLSNHWSDLTQILNLSLGDQTKLYKWFKWWQPPMEDDLKCYPVTDNTQISNLNLRESNKTLKMLQMKYDLQWKTYLSLGDQTTIYQFYKWRWSPMKDDLKILKVEYDDL